MEVAEVLARLEHVTVYSTGARVRRVTTIPAPLPARVRIAGLPLSVIDDTVRVSVGGPAIAVAVRVGVAAPSAEQAAAEDSEALRAARRRAALADAEVERLVRALELASAASVIEEDPSDAPPAPWDHVVAARRAVVALRAERELALRGELAAARRAAEDAKRALEAVHDRERRTGSARPAKLHELRKHVELELAATANDEIVVHLEYQVAAARWAPAYVARIDGDGVRLEVRAVVAHDSGEDWTAVPLRLSTAEPERFAALPELAAQRIGRRQAEPAKAGFRAPPEGAAALYADYLRERAQHAPAPYASDARALEERMIAGEVWDEESSRAKERFATPPQGTPAANLYQVQEQARGMPGGAPPPPMLIAPLAAMPMAAPQSTRAPGAPPEKKAMARRLGTRQEGGEPMADAIAHAAPPVPRLDYGNLRMAPPASPQRGSLVPAAPDRHASAVASELEAARARLAVLPLPPGCRADWVHAYDYAFETDGAVEVRSDGAWHAIAVTAQATTAKLRHVSVPREQADVFRVAQIANPLAGPLLPGPIDVYDRGRFLVTSAVDYTPPGATVEIGLGVDAAVKIARNTEFREEATGMLRGGLRLVHAIAIDVDNLSGRAIDLEVRERLPVARDGDDDVEVIAGRVDPPWERWTPDASAPHAARLRGGYRWRLAVPAGQKRQLRAGYEVKIAGKHELVGGNRRDA